MQVQDVSQLTGAIASEGLDGRYSKLTSLIAEVPPCENLDRSSATESNLSGVRTT